jgi:hypothetical protein
MNACSRGEHEHAQERAVRCAQGHAHQRSWFDPRGVVACRLAAAPPAASGTRSGRAPEAGPAVARTGGADWSWSWSGRRRLSLAGRIQPHVGRPTTLAADRCFGRLVDRDRSRDTT